MQYLKSLHMNKLPTHFVAPLFRHISLLSGRFRASDSSERNICELLVPYRHQQTDSDSRTVPDLLNDR